METILEYCGVELLKESSKYFLRFDAGELAVQMQKIEITKEEANSAVEDPKTIYNIIISYQNKRMFGNK